MVVSYASTIYTKEKLFFIKLLFRWTGSVWQLLWIDFVVFIIAYVLLAALYHNLLMHCPEQRVIFQAVIKWIGLMRTSVPLSFMLGFFVTSVLNRWWSTCLAIPWMAQPAFYCQSFVLANGASGDIARKIRITILRYLNLSWILMMAGISLHIKERFGFQKPGTKEKKFKLTWQKRLQLINDDSKVKKYYGKLVTEDEFAAFARSAELSNDDDLSYNPESWLPLTWATRLLHRAKSVGCIVEDRHYAFMVQTVQNLRASLGTVWSYSEFNIPLVYTQVAVTAVYIFLLTTLLSTQLVESSIITLNGGSTADIGNATADAPAPFNMRGIMVLYYLPILGALEFIFYLGWFKSGIGLLNPLGKDKADLPLSEILNSNLKLSVKLGGAEDSLFPSGLAEDGRAPEEQLCELLLAFDFGCVHAHDKFGSPSDTKRRLSARLLQKFQATGRRGLKSTVDALQFANMRKIVADTAGALSLRRKGSKDVAWSEKELRQGAASGSESVVFDARRRSWADEPRMPASASADDLQFLDFDASNAAGPATAVV